MYSRLQSNRRPGASTRSHTRICWCKARRRRDDVARHPPFTGTSMATRHRRRGLRPATAIPPSPRA
jgi:hypothetical protein